MNITIYDYVNEERWELDLEESKKEMYATVKNVEETYDQFSEEEEALWYAC